MGIHPTAIVHPEARLGRDVEIGPYSVVGAGVTLGDRVRVGSHCVLEGRTTVGAETEFLPFAMIGAMPGHLRDRGEGTELVIGARCSFREHVSVHRGTKGGAGRTVIGDETSLFAHAHVGHDCVLGRGVLLTNGAMLGGHVQVGDFAILGGGALVHQFVRIGTMTMVEGKCGVGQDVPPYCLGAGHRVRLAGLNEIGLERRGVPKDALWSAYRTIFRSGLPRAEALAKVRLDHVASAEVASFADFIAAAGKRGVARHGGR
jgi:UDP-N-acetylglucosamine acyltransferase